MKHISFAVRPRLFLPHHALSLSLSLSLSLRPGTTRRKGGVHWTRRWFTLEDHVITYFSKQGDLRPRGRMVLVPESRVASLSTRAHAFQVTTNAKELKVSADSAEERERWVVALDKEIQRLKGRVLKRRNGRNARCERKRGERAGKKAAQRPSSLSLLGVGCHKVRCGAPFCVLRT